MTTTGRPTITLPASVFDDLEPYTASRFHPSDGAALLYWLACQASHDPSDDDEEPVARASISDMVEASGLPSTQVKAYLEALEELEYITYEPLRGTKSRITLLWSALPDAANDDSDEDTVDHEFESQEDAFDDVIEDDDAFEHLGEELAKLKEHFARERRQTKTEIQRLDDALQQALARIDALAQGSAPSPQPVATGTSRPRGRRTDWSARESLVLTHLQQLYVENQHQGVPPRMLHARLHQEHGWNASRVNVVVARLVASNKLQAQGKARARRYIPMSDGQRAELQTTRSSQTHASAKAKRPSKSGTSTRGELRLAQTLKHIQDLMSESASTGVQPRELRTRLKEREGWSANAINITIKQLLESGAIKAEGHTTQRRYIPTSKPSPTVSSKTSDTITPSPKTNNPRSAIDWAARESIAMGHVRALIEASKGKGVRPKELRTHLKEREGWSANAINITIKQLLESGAIKAEGHTTQRRYNLVSIRAASTSTATNTSKPQPAPTRSKSAVNWVEREAHVLEHLRELASRSDEGVKPGELTAHILKHVPSMTQWHVVATFKRLLKAGRIYAEGATIHRRYFPAESNTQGEQIDTRSDASDADSPGEDVPQPAAASAPATPSPPPDLDDAQDKDETQTLPEDQDADEQAATVVEEIPSPTTSAPSDIDETPVNESQASAQDEPAAAPSADAVEREEPEASAEDPAAETLPDHMKATASEKPEQVTEDLEATDQPAQDLSAYEGVIAYITRDYNVTSQPDVDASDAAVVETTQHEAPSLESSLDQTVRTAYNAMTQGCAKAVIVSKLWHEAGEPPVHAFLAWLVLEIEAGHVSLSGRGTRVHLGDDPRAMLRHQGHDWGLVKFTEPAAPPEGEETTDDTTASTSS